MSTFSVTDTVLHTLRYSDKQETRTFYFERKVETKRCFGEASTNFSECQEKAICNAEKFCFRCTPEPGLYSNPSFRFSWLEWYNQFPIMVLPVTSILISAMYYHLCFLVLWLVHLRQVFPKVFTMKTSTLKVLRSPTIKILFNLIYKGFFKLILTTNCASSHHSPNAMPWYLLSTTF